MNETLKTPKLTDMICENLVSTKFENLTDWNVKCFKDRLLDITGCMFGGAIVPDNDVLTDLAKRWGGTTEAPVFLKGFRAPLDRAALINCIVARSNDYGNMFMHVFEDRIASHCGETLIPLGLTISDMTGGISGKDYITNNVAAEDLTGRILYTFVNRWPFDMLLVATAATALVSRYYGLSAERTKAALSYAATNATDPANSYYDYSQEFKYHNGESARCGVMSCELAKGGWTGLDDPFFGHWGLAVKDTKGDMPPNYEKAIQDLGKIYFTEESFKVFPGGIPNTPASIAGIKIRERFIDRYKVSDIAKVEVERSEITNKIYYSEPFSNVTQLNALFCYQFQACCALYYGDVRVEHVQTKAILERPDLVEMVQSSTMGVYYFEEGEPRIPGMRVRVTMKDGTVFEHTEPATAMHNYPTKEFIVGKFKKQFEAHGKLPAATADKIIELAFNIEKVSDMREYTSLLQI